MSRFKRNVSDAEPEYTAYIGSFMPSRARNNISAAAYIILNKQGNYSEGCKVFIDKNNVECQLIAIWSVLKKIPRGQNVRIVTQNNFVISTLSDKNITDTNNSKLKSQIIRELKHIGHWKLENPFSATDTSYSQLVSDWCRDAKIKYENEHSAINTAG